MALSPTGQRALDQMQSKPQLSAVGQKALQISQAKVTGDYIPLPSMGTANSTYNGSQGRATGADLSIANLPKAVFHGTTRGAAAAALTVKGMIEGTPQTYTASNPVSKFWFGKDPITLKSEVEDPLVAMGADEAAAKRAAPSLAILLTALDLTPGGGAAKNGIKALIKTVDVDDVAKLMKGMGMQERTIVEFGIPFSKASTEKEVVKLLDEAVIFNKKNSTPLKVVDDSEPVTVAGKVFTEQVVQARKVAVQLLDKAGEKVTAVVRNAIKREPKPSLMAFEETVRVLDNLKVDTTPLKAVVTDLSDTVKLDPERFGLDAGSKKPVVAKAVDTTVDKKALETSAIFKIDNRETLKATVKTQENATLLRLQYADELVAVEEQIMKSGGVAKVPAALVQKSNELAVAIKAVDEVVAELPTQADIALKAGEVPVGVLDEVADPVRENLGRVTTDIQTRYGKGAVTKSQVAKFTTNENVVFNQLAKYVEEMQFIAERGQTVMHQSMPQWVPSTLRNGQLFEELVEIMSKGQTPTIHGGPHMELYTALVDEAARKSGIKHSGPKPAIDPAGAILQSTRDALAPVGAPLVKVEPGVTPKAVKTGVVEETNFFDEVAEAKAQFVNKDEAYAGFNAFKADQQKTYVAKTKTAVVGKGWTFGDDISAFKAGFKDVFRNSEKFFGEQWTTVKTQIFDKFDDAKLGMVNEERAGVQALKDNVTVKFGIKKGTKASAAIMDLGEGLKTFDQVVEAFGPKRAGEIAEATKWFRGQYDTMIDAINSTRGPYNQIHKKDNYFRHYEELSSTGALLSNFEDVGLGNLADTKFWNRVKEHSFVKQRLGVTTRRDAVGGFLNYLPQYAYEKHLNPEISRINSFIDELKQAKAPKGYTTMLEKWSGDLTGQLNGFDKAFEVIPGGKATIEVVNWFNNRAKRNAILGNVGSSIAQAFNIPNGIASAGYHSANGMKRTMQDVFSAKPAWAESPFVNERFKNSMYDQFSTGFWEKTTDKAGWLISVFDEIGTKFIWNSHYEKAIKEGITDPVRYADNTTRKMVAGRGIGEVPLMQKSKVTQVVAPFQLEVMNTLFVLKDFVDEKQYGKIVTFMAASYMMNQAANGIMGREVTFNPIQAIMDSGEIAMSDESALDKGKHIAGRLAGETLSAIPMGNYVAAGGAKIAGMTEKEREEFFTKQGDPVKYGTTPLLWNAITDPLYGLLLPLGGKQIEKTVGGVGHLGEKNPDPMIRPDYSGVPGAVQNVLFGKWGPNIKYEADLEREMRHEYQKNVVLVNSGDAEQAKEAQASVDKLPDNIWPIYKRVATEESLKEEKRQQKAMQPTIRVIDALMKDNKEVEAQEIVERMTETEWKVYAGARKAARTEAYEKEKELELNPEWQIKEAIDYAYAFGTNPVQAYNVMFVNKEHIEDTVGGVFSGVVRTRRITEDESEAVKKELGHKSGDGQILEHKLPLSVGGSNKRDNLELVEGSVHDAWTPVELALAKAVREKRINYVQAQELILRHKGYEGTSISYEEIKLIINKD